MHALTLLTALLTTLPLTSALPPRKNTHYLPYHHPVARDALPPRKGTNSLPYHHPVARAALPPRKGTNSLPYHHPVARSAPSCPTPHLPTTLDYDLAVSTYCAHFPTTLSPHVPLVYTYALHDGRGQPIKWVLSTTWDDNSNGANGGKEGVMTVQKGSCEAWFEALRDECGEGLVRGGKRNVWEGRVKGAKVWVESRVRGGE